MNKISELSSKIDDLEILTEKLFIIWISYKFEIKKKRLNFNRPTL